ncbi:MAG: hypothetical protein JSW54_00970 [Fidelibacterota bacterium]|nr:MAG: hypothetical protein JSW54_00970 [Candidatus Neomarinimicrobiota bacterium]
MKRSYFLVLLFLWTCGRGPTQIQEGTWELVRAAEGDVRYAALHFADQSHGWVVGDAGTIVHTGDGGWTWTAQQSGCSSDLNAVQFVDRDYGWVAGHENTLMHTEDGGQTWQSRAPVGDSSRTFTALYFPDEATGWVVHTQGELLHTGNGGATWDVQLSWEQGGSALIAFVDDQVGYARPVVDTVLYKTRDGGHSWLTLDSPPFYHWRRDMFFVDEQHGWIPASTAPS